MRFSIAGVALGAVAAVAQQSGLHTDWDRWCGKVYEPGYPAFDPGGETTEPPVIQGGPNLYVQIKPRHSLYLESEAEGEFVVNAQISQWYGQPWPNLTDPDNAPNLVFSINLSSTDDILVENSIEVNTTGVFAFDLSKLTPSTDPYEVVLFGAAEPGSPNITAVTELYYLPEKTNGSVTKLDNLNGGFHFRNSRTNGTFVPFFPWGFYASDSGFLSANDSISQIQAYQDLGLSGMTPLSHTYDTIPEFQYMDKIDLRFMYDLREYFQNLTAVQEQVEVIKDYDALFSYWNSDEPDGWQYAFNSTVLSRALIQSIDPYHPSTNVLNCHNYYFPEYSVSADFIMEDAYPIGINSTWSKWGTPCNATLGDCGCDDCEGNVQDVPKRLDDLAQYERWLGLWPKTKVHNPQSFDGEDYWFRYPTVAEEVVMCTLAINHGAKAIISWTWPTTDELAQVHGELSKVFTTQPVVDFLVREKPTSVVMPDEVLDVAYWVLGQKLLVNVVNGGYVDIDGPIAISFEPEPSGLDKQVWGDVPWQLLGGQLTASNLTAMSASLVILDL